MSESLSQAASQIQSSYTSLPASLRAHLTVASGTLHRYLPHQVFEISTQLFAKVTSDPKFLLAILSPLLILLYSMSRSAWSSSSGRFSPFYADPDGPPRVTKEDYTYMTGDENDRYSHSRHNNDSYASHHPSRAPAADLDPDTLTLKHKGITYPLHFPAFAISEGHLKVRDLRRLAALETKTADPRRVKLLYKSRSLRDDARSCKEEGLKQNSELMCVVSADTPPMGDSYASSSSASEAAMGNGVDAYTAGAGPRIDVDGRIIDEGRSGGGKRKKHRTGKKKNRTPPEARSPPQQQQQQQQQQQHSSTHNNLAPSSAANGPSATIRSRQPSPAPPRRPQTPSETLDSIAEKFHTEFLPQVKNFLAHPPADSKTRDFEYKKLSESILAQVLLKADEVMVEGDGGLRARRKGVVTETQGWLNELDRAVGKRGAF